MKHDTDQEARRAADRFLREVARGLIAADDVRSALDKAVAAATAEFLDTVNAAAFLDCSTQQLEIWRHEHQGPPYHRLGKRIRYSRADLIQWMTRTRVEPEAA